MMFWPALVQRDVCGALRATGRPLSVAAWSGAFFANDFQRRSSIPHVRSQSGLSLTSQQTN